MRKLIDSVKRVRDILSRDLVKDLVIAAAVAVSVTATVGFFWLLIAASKWMVTKSASAGHAWLGWVGVVFVWGTLFALALGHAAKAQAEKEDSPPE